MILSWESLQEVFVMLVVIVVFFSFTGGFSVIVFRRHPSPFPEPSLVFTPILYFQPTSSQSNSQHFHFNFSGFFIFTTSAVVLSGRFLFTGYGFEKAFFNHRRLLPYTPSFAPQMWAETTHLGSSSFLALLFSCPFRFTHGI